MMPKDVFQVADLAEKMHAESKYKHINFDKRKVTTSFLHAMANLLLVGFVDDKEGNIVGAVVGMLDTFYFGGDYLVVGRGFYVLPEYRKSKTGVKLLREYIAAGEKIGVKEITLDTSGADDPNALDLLYKKVGFDKIGSLYRIGI
jgi:GNAT superfamily N-acetyltransferase